MNVMVYDIAAEYGGAVTILKNFYEQYSNNNNGNTYYFVLSVVQFEDTPNVKVINYPWVKKSWFHRLYFDIFIARKIIHRYKIDEILSLQNVLVWGVKKKQTLYLHQPLPFIEKRYRITENFVFWVYQNVISKMIYRSVKRADKVIVQTNWMKRACLQKVNTDPAKFCVEKPELNINVTKTYEKDITKETQFFYPASALTYKNHSVIIEAARNLKKQDITNYKIVFTLTGNENKCIKHLYDIAQENNLPIEFCGQISLETVYDYYSRSILIFPSYIETFGLPLLEARLHGCPIIASDCAFSHEILDEYKEARFFDPFNPKELMLEMRKFI